LKKAQEQEYNGADPTRTLLRATELNPLHSAAWIRLGLRAEMQGNFPEAEALLLRAASVDRQFEPRWTLANYYFRRGDLPNFWQWTRQALETSYGDRRPLFDLCWRAGSDPAIILQSAIPTKPEVIASYIDFLIQEKHLSAVAEAAKKLGSGQTAVRDRAVSALLEAGDASSIRDLLGVRTHRFQWIRILDEGSRFSSDNGSIRLDLTGRQPEACELAAQFVLLEPGRRYRLQWKTDSDAPGFFLQIAGAEFPVAARAAEFEAPALTRLVLRYARPLGSARFEGTLELRDISITPL
jgi:hypothetical protein